MNGDEIECSFKFELITHIYSYMLIFFAMLVSSPVPHLNKLS